MKEKTKNLAKLVTGSVIIGSGFILGIDSIADMSAGIMSSLNITATNATELGGGAALVSYGIGLIANYIKKC